MKDYKLKAIAVDDEQHCLDTLVWELSRSCPEVEVVCQITEEDEARERIPQEDIDILFMDIHLQASNGVNLVKELQPLDCAVIFITAYDQYAIEAFEVAAVHYLLKPINSEMLRSAIDRIIEKRNENERVTIDRIMTALKETKFRKQRIPFSVQSGIEFVVLDDIIYVSGENNYSLIHFVDGKKLMVSKTLSTVEKMLSDHTFLRIHKSYILNLQHIVRYVKAEGGYIEVVGGTQLSVSRSRRAAVNELFRNPI
ncbi:MAG: response regulator transcription factor [Saprospiraceae bacterium]|nr:response regulator transcription factor [Saprospiraceae bacterium]